MKLERKFGRINDVFIAVHLRGHWKVLDTMLASSSPTDEDDGSGRSTAEAASIIVSAISIVSLSLNLYCLNLD